MKKFTVFIILVFTLVALVGCGSKKTEEYKENVLDLSNKILSNSAEAEELASKYSTVWQHTIQSSGAIPVSEMSSVTGISEEDILEFFTINNAGNIPDDFSININSLNNYYEGIGKLDELQEVANEIKEKVSELNDPPKGFEKVYDEILDTYNLSEEYLEMIINPSGSLTSFNQEKQRLTTEILSKHKRIEVLIPNE